MAEDDDKMFMSRSLNVTPKTTQQHLIVRNDKSEAEVTSDQLLVLGSNSLIMVDFARVIKALGLSICL